MYIISNVLLVINYAFATFIIETEVPWAHKTLSMILPHSKHNRYKKMSAAFFHKSAFS